MDNYKINKGLISRKNFLFFIGGAILASTLPAGMLAAANKEKSSIEFVESSCEKDGKVKKKILVTYASRCGSTGEIAYEINKVLCESGASTDIRFIKNVDDISMYDAVIVGGAVRIGKWLPEAADFIKKHKETLAKLPVSLFIACLAMKEDTPENRKTALKYIDPVLKENSKIKPVDIGLFGGALDFNKVSFINKVILKAKGKTEGDFRNWDAIKKWANDISRKII